jgi:hypothetical protein
MHLESPHFDEPCRTMSSQEERSEKLAGSDNALADLRSRLKIALSNPGAQSVFEALLNFKWVERHAG